MVSLFEEEQQDLEKPEPARQYSLQLDSRLTISTKRRHLSTEPVDEKGLRMFDRANFLGFFGRPLDRDNFNFYKEVEGQPLSAPRWSFCLSYELEIRKEAIRLCKEESYGPLSGPRSRIRSTV